MRFNYVLCWIVVSSFLLIFLGIFLRCFVFYIKYFFLTFCKVTISQLTITYVVLVGIIKTIIKMPMCLLCTYHCWSAQTDDRVFFYQFSGDTTSRWRALQSRTTANVLGNFRYIRLHTIGSLDVSQYSWQAYQGSVSNEVEFKNFGSLYCSFLFCKFIIKRKRHWKVFFYVRSSMFINHQIFFWNVSSAILRH